MQEISGDGNSPEDELQVANRILEQIRSDINRFFSETDDEEIRKIYVWCGGQASIVGEVKLPKPVEDESGEVETPYLEVSDAIPSIIRIKLTTPNKTQAQQMFDYLRHSYTHDDKWFTKKVKDEPKFEKFVKDYYEQSKTTGYQAYHIYFQYDTQDAFGPDVERKVWQVEFRILSKLWDFYAEYSRKHLGRTLEDWDVADLSATISNILDSAEDLMIVAQTQLIQGDYHQAYDPEATHQIAERVKEWLTKERLEMLSGRKANMPKPVFRIKMQKAADRYGVTLDDIERFAHDPEIKKRHVSILNATQGLSYLPPYQSMLMYLFIGKGMTDEEVLALMNPEVWTLMGYELKAPSQGSDVESQSSTQAVEEPPHSDIRTGYINDFNVERSFGLAIDNEESDNPFLFWPEAFDCYVPPEIWHMLPNQRIQFRVGFSKNKGRYVVLPKTMSFNDDFMREIDKALANRR